MTVLKRVFQKMGLQPFLFDENGDIYVVLENSFELYFATSDEGIEYGDGQNLILKRNQNKDSVSTRVASQLLPYMETYIDVGANIGLSYVMLAGKLGVKNIYAFEPNPSILSHLYKNLKKNNMNEIIKVSEYAISDQLAHNSIQTLNRGSNNRITPPNSHKLRDKLAEVSTISLDSFFEDTLVASHILLKIDVEGYELNVLKSGQELICKYNPIIIYEEIPELLGEYGVTVEELRRFLISRNYNVYMIPETNDRLAINPATTDISNFHFLSSLVRVDFDDISGNYG